MLTVEKVQEISEEVLKSFQSIETLEHIAEIKAINQDLILVCRPHIRQLTTQGIVKDSNTIAKEELEAMMSPLLVLKVGKKAKDYGYDITEGESKVLLTNQAQPLFSTLAFKTKKDLNKVQERKVHKTKVITSIDNESNSEAAKLIASLDVFVIRIYYIHNVAVVL